MELADILRARAGPRARHRQRRPLRDLRRSPAARRRDPQRRRRRLVHPGDKVIVITYAQYDESRARQRTSPSRARRRAQPTDGALRPRGGRRRNSALMCELISPTDVHRSPRTRERRRRLSAARPPGAGMSVTVLTKGELGWSATWRRAASPPRSSTTTTRPSCTAPTPSPPARSVRRSDAVRVLVTEGPDRVRELIASAPSSTTADDDEPAAPRRARVGTRRARRARRWRRHRRRDRARALVAAVRLGAEVIREGWLALRPRVEGRARRRARGRSDGGPRARGSPRADRDRWRGQCFAITTNPALDRRRHRHGHARGVAVADLEFMQFHPTALHHPSMPRPLLSEALRGEGAVLRDEQGVAFMVGEHPLADLALATSSPRRSAGASSATSTTCGSTPPPSTTSPPGSRPSGRRAGRSGSTPARLAPGRARRALPLGRGVHRSRRRHDVARAVGVRRGRLHGVHGANRLASNSLLEGLVFSGARVSRRSATGKDGPEATGVLRGVVVGPCLDRLR